MMHNRIATVCTTPFRSQKDARRDGSDRDTICLRYARSVERASSLPFAWAECWTQLLHNPSQYARHKMSENLTLLGGTLCTTTALGSHTTLAVGHRCLTRKHKSASSPLRGTCLIPPISVANPPTTSNTSRRKHILKPCGFRTMVGTRGSQFTLPPTVQSSSSGNHEGRPSTHPRTARPPTATTLGSRKSPVNRTNHSGSATASSSRKATRSAWARSMPAFRLPETPAGPSLSTTRAH